MWNFIKEKWLTMLLAVFLGCLLWWYVNRVETSSDRLEAVLLVTQPSGTNLRVSVEPDVKRVRLILQGPTLAIYEATRSDRDVQVVYNPQDAETFADGKSREVFLNRSMVSKLPSDVEVTQFIPSSIQVTVNRIVEKTLPVARPETVGTPETGYEVYERQVVRPKEVLVSGPESLLNQLKEVKPEPVDVTGRAADFRNLEHRLIRDYSVEDGITGQISTRATVEVFVGIRRQAVHMKVRGIQIEIAQPETRPPAKPLDIEIVSPTNPTDLDLEGPDEALKQIKPESLRCLIYIDAGARKPEDDTPFKETLVVLGLPEGVKLAKEVVVTARLRSKAEPQPVTGAPKP